MSFDLWLFEVEWRWPHLKVRRHRHRVHRRSVRLVIVGQEGGGTVHATFRRRGHGRDREVGQHG